MNIRIFDYDEIINIMKDKQHKDNDYILRWFGDLEEDFKDDEGNYEIFFSEDCIEVYPDNYFLVDEKIGYGTVLENLENLKHKIGELLKESKKYEEKQKEDNNE